MKLTKLVSALLAAYTSFSGFAMPNVIQSSLPLQFVGAIPDQSATGVDFAQIAANGQGAQGGVNFTASAGATATLTALGNALFQFTNGGAVTVTLDSAYNIVPQLPGPQTVGEKFTFSIMTNAGTTIATPTLLSTDVTLAGTTTLTAAALRWYQGVITQMTSVTGMPTTAGTTFSSISQIGSSNLFTVTLGTNSLVPVVGTLINLTAITGTLPAGWYPIVKVTSATSFVIATPAGTVWTCTAATVGTGTTAPATFAPLVTITGLMTTVTATMAV
jgi:hypothetical protein